ncbi:hypothetical protein [Parasitella parasitica]|uniref:Helitron helicase-like domain-containing protein n=1 Tax=Parasitella parasitica TaxID=35722 RepID=A0A0B7MY24_9FUNG|nr:hypothetical protein [Parasitella parasitica]
MFPLGDSGWNINIRQYDPSAMMEVDELITNAKDRNRAEVSVMQYYSFRLIIRVDQEDSSVPRKIYNVLADAICLDDTGMRAVGRRAILPSTFLGGPRFMAQLYQDATNLVRRFGKPNLFIIFSCNPAYSQIFCELKANQRTSDRPDLCDRAVNLKLKALLEDIVKHLVLGKVVAYCYTIEFQKRGLPHCYMLLILSEEGKPRKSEDIDNIVSAEIPDLETHPLPRGTMYEEWNVL